MKVDILAIGVHPDDVELSCSGTLIKHISLGKKVAIIDLTQGEMGTRGTPKLREQEANKAKEIIGAKFRECLNMKDAFFVNDYDHQKKIIEVIRKYQPEIVICNAVTDRHPDHGRSSNLVSDACFYAGLQKIETTFDNKLQACWRPKVIYHYIQDQYIHPNLIVDVTNVIAKKRESILAYSSQFYNKNSKHILLV